ncbi:unnamed protein product [Bursaphelenchus xylophilus]|uniref:(pine wood nematode) hypothetical protein n=1 Tax=Bursaphelenchus xylophilus TaxID=6326 RepID=A0A1I7RLJ6_BURXY|nr:unnamed protein product [Bursaphelenchus xylophilus]CAG9082914.1 unnamed protein product [Bursaphelenchus xylophilus]
MRIKLLKALGLSAAALSTSAAIGWYQRGAYLPEYEILDPKDAVYNINHSLNLQKSIRALEAMADLSPNTVEGCLAGLDRVGWAGLAYHKSRLFDHYHTNVEHPEKEEGQTFTSLMQKIELDKNWRKALRWFFLNVCAEDDLICHDNQEPERTARSKRKRIHRVLQVLFYLTEFDDCKPMIDQKVPQMLHMLFEEYREDEHAELVILMLKILANIAGYNKECATHVFDSEWMKTLGEMILNPKMKVEPLLARKVLKNGCYQLGAAHYKLPTDIYEFYCSDEEPKMDIIFVHGFRGSVFRTWRQKDLSTERPTQFWPMDWLPTDIQTPVRILAIDYATKFLRFGKVYDRIQDRSHAFQKSLQSVGVGDRPILFICHSMGGLLVKQMLLDNPQLMKNTVGILFMATPHRGSPVVAYIHHLLRPTEDIRLLRLDSEYNRDLHEKFVEKSKDIPLITTIIENKLTPIFGTHKVIVPANSAFFGRGAVYHVSEHHHNVCKPANRESLTYCVIMNMIKDAIQNYT